jgi:hypothetical protein
MERAVTIRVRERDYDLLDQHLRAIAPQKKKGFPKACIIEGFWKSLVIALYRPDPYPLGEMLYRMSLAAIRPEDTEGQEMIDTLYK